ncbi:type II toxin-antitoxin system VapC family toxin [Tundrisphaera sp. TA3]|uniref:type II toxin-antitoxin system VapC family toxin n=1 Tax=Tundrisphaera sp. TA3 TaxID=3435775 RepID=UPI003EBC808E
MAYLLDTNVLVRMANTLGEGYAVTHRAIIRLHRQGESLHVTPQNLIEFRNVATRPASVNGLDLPPIEAALMADGFEATFPLLPDTEAIYPAWKALVEGMGIVGKQVHDARLVAVCHAHGIDHLLTFNARHFARMARFGPGLNVVEPAGV